MHEQKMTVNVHFRSKKKKMNLSSLRVGVLAFFETPAFKYTLSQLAYTLMLDAWLYELFWLVCSSVGVMPF